MAIVRKRGFAGLFLLNILNHFYLFSIIYKHAICLISVAYCLFPPCMGQSRYIPYNMKIYFTLIIRYNNAS